MCITDQKTNATQSTECALSIWFLVQTCWGDQIPSISAEHKKYLDKLTYQYVGEVV